MNAEDGIVLATAETFIEKVAGKEVKVLRELAI